MAWLLVFSGGLQLCQQSGLIALDGHNLVVTTLDNQLSSFFGSAVHLG